MAGASVLSAPAAAAVVVSGAFVSAGFDEHPAILAVVITASPSAANFFVKFFFIIPSPLPFVDDNIITFQYSHYNVAAPKPEPRFCAFAQLPFFFISTHFNYGDIEHHQVFRPPWVPVQQFLDLCKAIV